MTPDERLREIRRQNIAKANQVRTRRKEMREGTKGDPRKVARLIRLNPPCIHKLTPEQMVMWTWKVGPQRAETIVRRAVPSIQEGSLMADLDLAQRAKIASKLQAECGSMRA